MILNPHNFAAPSFENTSSFNHAEINSFTSFGFSHSAQCDASTCFRVTCGIVLSMLFPNDGGRAVSLSAWMKSTGHVMRRFRMASSSL